MMLCMAAGVMISLCEGERAAGHGVHHGEDGDCGQKKHEQQRQDALGDVSDHGANPSGNGTEVAGAPTGPIA